MIDVVVATVGRPSLRELAEELARCGVVRKVYCVFSPDVLQDEDLVSKLIIHSWKIVVLTSLAPGQVAQRAVGLALVDAPFVMHCDDDVELNCLSISDLLYRHLKCLGAHDVIGPVFQQRNAPTFNSLRQRLLLACFFKPSDRSLGGRMSKAGFGLPLSPTQRATYRLIEVEWLQGALWLYRSHTIVPFDYYRSSSAARGEDLILSQIRREFIGGRLYVDPSIKVRLGESPYKPRLADLNRDLATDLSIAVRTGSNKALIRAFYVFKVVNFFIRKMCD